MQDIKHRELKMQEMRKKTSFRNYLKTIGSMRSFSFYKHQGYTSIFPNTIRTSNIISHKEFEEKRNGNQIFLEYDFLLSFFENYKMLFERIALPPTVIFGDCENANFSDQSVNIKNVYLSYVVIKDCENILYSLSVKGSKNIINSVLTWDGAENIYFSQGIITSFNIFFSKYIHNSSNIRFCGNMTGCHDCIFCENLENKRYCIHNKQYTKEVFLQKKQIFLQEKKSFLKWYLNIKTFGDNIGSKNIDGIFNIKCENIKNGFYNYQIKDSQNIFFIGGKDNGERVFDCLLNTPPQKDFYGVFSAGFGEHIYNSFHISGCSKIYYSALLENCSYCLGCIGLKNKQFCILNKQYTKEERFELANKIFAKMESDGELGKFFPGWMNPFYFNDTVAYLIDDSFTKEEVEAEGYLRRDEEIKVDIPEGSEVVYTNSHSREGGNPGTEEMNSPSNLEGARGSKNRQTLDDYQGFDENGEREIDPQILKKVILDEKGNAYRIVKMEYDFLMKYGLPLPELHWLDRIKLGFKFN